MPRLSPWKSAVVWDLVNVAAAAARRTVRGRTLLVRYEDFVRNPDGTLELVAERLGRSHRAMAINGTVAPPRHTMSGNPAVRLHGAPLTIDPLVPRGRGPGDRLVTMLTAPWLGRYGYRGSNGPGPAPADALHAAHDDRVA
jgi:hypothetical protein